MRKDSRKIKTMSIIVMLLILTTYIVMDQVGVLPIMECKIEKNGQDYSSLREIENYEANQNFFIEKCNEHKKNNNDTPSTDAADQNLPIEECNNGIMMTILKRTGQTLLDIVMLERQKTSLDNCLGDLNVEFSYPDILGIILAWIIAILFLPLTLSIQVIRLSHHMFTLTCLTYEMFKLRCERLNNTTMI